MTGSRERAWKANLLVPAEDPAEVEEAYELLRDIAYPKGFVRLLGLTGKREYSDLVERLPLLAARFGKEGVFATSTALELSTFADNLVAGMEALGGVGVFPTTALPCVVSRSILPVGRRFPERAFYHLLFPVTQDMVSGDYP